VTVSRSSRRTVGGTGAATSTHRKPLNLNSDAPNWSCERIATSLFGPPPLQFPVTFDSRKLALARMLAGRLEQAPIHLKNPLEGYRRLTFMMLDADIVAVSPSSVWRVLGQAGLLAK
jgi:hypothetical protein